jgi:hypothetical protein
MSTYSSTRSQLQNNSTKLIKYGFFDEKSLKQAYSMLGERITELDKAINPLPAIAD